MVEYSITLIEENIVLRIIEMMKSKFPYIHMYIDNNTISFKSPPSQIIDINNEIHIVIKSH